MKPSEHVFGLSHEYLDGHRLSNLKNCRGGELEVNSDLVAVDSNPTLLDETAGGSATGGTMRVDKDVDDVAALGRGGMALGNVYW